MLCLVHTILASLSVSSLFNNLSANFSYDYRGVLVREGSLDRFLVFLETLQFELPYWTCCSNHDLIAASGQKVDSISLWPLQQLIICHSGRFHNLIN